ARIEAVCRRTATRPTAVMQVGELTLDLATRRVSRPDGEVELTPTEFSLLELLMRHAGQVVTRKMLCEHLWESDWEGTTNVFEGIDRKAAAHAHEKLFVQLIGSDGAVVRSTNGTPDAELPLTSNRPGADGAGAAESSLGGFRVTQLRLDSAGRFNSAGLPAY